MKSYVTITDQSLKKLLIHKIANVPRALGQGSFGKKYFAIYETNCFNNNLKSIFFNKDNKITTANYKPISKFAFSSKDATAKASKSNFLKAYKEKIDKSIIFSEEIFPKEFKTKEDMMNYFDIDKICPNIVLKGQVPLDSTTKGILDPCWDMMVRGGKRWRPILGLIITEIFKLDLDNPIEDENKKLYYKILYLVESLHNASLIIDDVEDKSEQRRNAPCVHLKFGEAISLNAGIALLFFPFYKILQEIKDPILYNDLCRAYFEELSAIHVGQGWDIEMKITNRIPLPENYRDTVLMKTGVCPRLIVKMLRALIKHGMKVNSSIIKAKVSPEQVDQIFDILINIVDNTSISFQIKDDLLNIADSELSKGKGFYGEDIFEGKMTLMILHTLNKKIEKPEDEVNQKRLKEILELKTKDQKLIREAVEILKINGSIAWAYDIMDNHCVIALNLCDKIAEIIQSSSMKDQLNLDAIKNIKGMICYLIDRNV